MNEEIITKELQAFNTTDAAIAQLKQNYMALVITDLADQKTFNLVHNARMDVKNKRVAVTKKGKELREDAVKFQKAVIAEEKRIVDLLVPIEVHLATEEGKVEAEKDRIKAEAEAKEAAHIQARIDRICAFGASFNGQTYLSYGLQLPVALLKVCTDEQFETFCRQIQEAKDAEEAKAKVAEKARKAEAEHLANETRKLAIKAKIQALRNVFIDSEMTSMDLERFIEKYKEKRLPGEEYQEFYDEALQAYQEVISFLCKMHGEKVERENQTAALKLQKAEQEAAAKKIREDQGAIERAKQKLIDDEVKRLKAEEAEALRKIEEAAAREMAIVNEKRHALELEQARKEAAEKAVKDAQEKAEREAAEKIEKERKAKEAAERKAARQPDKVKLLAYADAIAALVAPELKTEEAKNILIEVENELDHVLTVLRERVGKL